MNNLPFRASCYEIKDANLLSMIWESSICFRINSGLIAPDVETRGLGGQLHKITESQKELRDDLGRIELPYSVNQDVLLASRRYGTSSNLKCISIQRFYSGRWPSRMIPSPLRHTKFAARLCWKEEFLVFASTHRKKGSQQVPSTIDWY